MERGTWWDHFCINTWWAKSEDDISFSKFGTPGQRVIYTSAAACWSMFQAVSSAPPCSSLTSAIRAQATRGFERLVKRPHCVPLAVGAAALIWIVTWLVFPAPLPEVWAGFVSITGVTSFKHWRTWPSQPRGSFQDKFWKDIGTALYYSVCSRPITVTIASFCRLWKACIISSAFHLCTSWWKEH